MAQRLKEPRTKPRAVATASQVHVRAYECILHQVCRRVTIEHHRDRVAVQEVLIAPHELRELLRLAAEHPRDHGGIVGRRHRGVMEVSGSHTHQDTTSSAT